VRKVRASRTLTGSCFTTRIDLETCCYGPIEFDIAYAPNEVGHHYTHVDRLQLRDCRLLKLAMVAAWSADRDDQFPNGPEMRDGLLREIREAIEIRRAAPLSQAAWPGG
jgi:hypothetical protein